MKNIAFVENMKSIMKKAWYIVKSYGWTMSEALKHAWLLFKTRKEMMKRIVKFTFTKVDGSIRQAFGTLDPIVAEVAEGSGRKPNPSLFTYWDTEKQGWRCFKIANLLSVEL